MQLYRDFEINSLIVSILSGIWSIILWCIIFILIHKVSYLDILENLKQLHSSVPNILFILILLLSSFVLGEVLSFFSESLLDSAFDKRPIFTQLGKDINNIVQSINTKFELISPFENGKYLSLKNLLLFPSYSSKELNKVNNFIVEKVYLNLYRSKLLMNIYFSIILVALFIFLDSTYQAITMKGSIDITFSANWLYQGSFIFISILVLPKKVLERILFSERSFLLKLLNYLAVIIGILLSTLSVAITVKVHGYLATILLLSASFMVFYIIHLIAKKSIEYKAEANSLIYILSKFNFYKQNY